MTVAEIVALIHRQKAALCEVGRPDLAEHLHARIAEDGRLSISFERPRRRANGSEHHSPEVLKAMSIDPMFQWNGASS